jgi:nitrite reductase (NADH) large subunit
MRLLIIGNGVAGVTTARYVAERDPSIEIGLYSREPYAYYPRPRLIDFVAGKLPLEELPQYDAAWYQQRHIDVQLGRKVTALDPGERCITLADGSQERYDRLVLATGARPWVPPIPGADRDGVHTLRTLEDAVALCREARQGAPILILGGGLLGLDTALALRSYGVDVTVVEALPWLLPRQLDREGAGLLQQVCEARGVRIITGDLCAEIQGNGHVQGARLKSGAPLQAGVVLVSAGVQPKIDLAQAAGLACNRGIVVDARMQTSDPCIYAVGDAAEFGGRVWGIIPAALAQARVAAAQITGHTETVYREIVPSTTLQVTGIALTSLGEVNPEGGDYREVRYLDEANCIYKKLVIRENKVVGAILLGDRSDLAAVNQLVSRGLGVSGVAERLLEPGFDLAAFVREHGARVR